MPELEYPCAPAAHSTHEDGQQVERIRLLDVWLRTGLAKRYDPVLREALPPELLAVLSRAS